MRESIMRYAKYLHIFLLSLSATLLYGNENDTGCINPSPECPEPSVCDRNDCCSDPCCDQDLYEDYAWYVTAPDTDYEFAREHNLWGIWLPEGPPAFRPFIADPRQVTFGVGWRFNDRTLGKNLIPVSFGNNFPIFRWIDIWCFRGDLQLEIEGAVWAIFDPLHESSPLIDADYYVGFPLTYLFGDWAFRARGYHISTHIGDEFLLDHPHFDRRNPSIEAFDFYVSYQYTRDIRLYGGIGWVACQDDSYRVGPFYAQVGSEIRFSGLGYRDYCNRLYGEPFFAMDFYYQSHFKHHINSTFALGYEWGKVSGIRRKFRIFLEYHDGYSVEGQFSKSPTRYLSIRGTYGF
jgi:hypothetical protein